MRKGAVVSKVPIIFVVEQFLKFYSIIPYISSKIKEVEGLLKIIDIFG
jgi:hypothetical protein